ncbi:MAG TPA: hypothetical protein V6D06_00750 [Trichocoleus sp.]
MATPSGGRGQAIGLLRRRTAKRLPPGSKVQLWVRSHPRFYHFWRFRRVRRGLSLVLTALLLWGAIALLVLSLRWSVQLMVNPDALPWLQARLGRATLSDSQTVTLAAVAAELGAQGRVLGEPMPLKAQQQEVEIEFLLYPVQAASGGTPEIVELRLYRPLPGQPSASAEPSEALMQAVATLPVERLSDEVILAPLLRTPQKILPSKQAFPMTALKRLPAHTSADGIWLTLQGQWQRSGVTLRYGRLVYFEPRRRALEILTAWSTPNRQLPQWADLDGAEHVDLLIDQTVGLEPAIQGFRVQSRQGLGAAMQLVPVSFSSVPVDVNDSGAYYRALTLARSGLWSAALKQLEPLKAKLDKKWTPSAQAQLQLVQLHAERTRQQAERKWSVPSQQILASLVDGRWEAALKQLEAAPQTQESLMRTLAKDEGRFWNRVTAALRSGTKDPAALVWGGLILKAQQDQQAALAWLAEQKVPAATRSRFWAVANPPVVAAAPPKPAAAATPVADKAADQPSGAIAPLQDLLGKATPLPNVNPAQWQPLQDSQPITLGPQQRWYDIQVMGWQRWGIWADQRQSTWPPGASTGLKQALAAVLTDPLYLLPQGTTAQISPQALQVKGLRLEEGRLRLLAAGSGSATGLAFSADSLYWLDSTSVGSAQSNEAVAAALETLLGATISAEALQPVLATATLEALDATADGRDDWVLTVQPQELDLLANLGVNVDRTAPKTLIINPEGRLLYSDLLLPQRLLAVTNPVRSRQVALLVEQNDRYTLQLWSPEQRQFE